MAWAACEIKSIKWQQCTNSKHVWNRDGTAVEHNQVYRVVCTQAFWQHWYRVYSAGQQWMCTRELGVGNHESLQEVYCCRPS